MKKAKKVNDDEFHLGLRINRSMRDRLDRLCAKIDSNCGTKTTRSNIVRMCLNSALPELEEEANKK